jgi:flagellar basal-body rod protein FlgG
MYIAASGMLAEEAAQQVVAQNLANASTTGYKEDIPIFRSFEENLISFADGNGSVQDQVGALGSGAEMQNTVTDLAQGPLIKTENPLDIAPVGNAFMAVQTPGGTRYTRDGALTISSSGTLVQTASGFSILDTAGRPIKVAVNATDLRIDPDGSVRAGKQILGRLGLYSITNEMRPQKIGSNLYATATPPPALDVTRDPSSGVRGGYIEGSNVNIVKEMVTMIAGLRAYEANQKTVQGHDNMDDKCVNQVGRLV